MPTPDGGIRETRAVGEKPDPTRVSVTLPAFETVEGLTRSRENPG